MLCLAILACCSAAALATDAITGVVRNQTSGRLAAGDEVILLRLDQTSLNQGMPEEARTRTDSQGAFTIKVRYPDAPHLVRVLHQGVNYDQRASPGMALSIDVFDAVSKVQGVTSSIEIIRIGTAGNRLHVSDMVEIKNDSSPPLTLAGEHTFEAYLPAHAKIDSVLAAGPGKVAVLISAAPVDGEPGHYAVNFPLRPGATKFAFNYDLPYDGRATFRPKSMYPQQQLAVMIPPTMKFTSRSPAFQVLGTGNDHYQVEAANHVKAGEGPEFEISGVGALPALPAQTQSPQKPQVSAAPNPALSAQGGSGAPVRGANSLSVVPGFGLFAPSSRLQWWVLGASAVLVVGACGFLLGRRPQRSADAMTTAVQKTEEPGQPSAPLVEVLKGQMFQLEVDRLLGTISAEEYDSAQQALEVTVKRALAPLESAEKLPKTDSGLTKAGRGPTITPRESPCVRAKLHP